MSTALFGNFANFGFIRDKVPEGLFNKLKEEVLSVDLTSTENKINYNLAGNIEKEYKLGKNQQEFEEYLLGLCKQYTSNWDITRTTKDLSSENLELYNYWTNFQKKNEFNPIHAHDGTYSFALWIQVPYYILEEINQKSSVESNSPRAGMFSFFYNNMFGEIREVEFPVDKTYEGTIFLFPSCLQHMVYPFSSSDEYRISISGNLRKKK